MTETEHQLGQRIFHVDDFSEVLQGVSDYLRLATLHRVVLSAGSITEARALIPQRLEELSVSVALLDNQLGDGFGVEIAEMIRESGLAVAIIAFSTDNVEWGDYYSPKTGSIDYLIGLLDTIE